MNSLNSKHIVPKLSSFIYLFIDNYSFLCLVHVLSCPLYTKLYLRNSSTILSLESIDRQTEWGRVYACDFASFAYLSTFVVSFISLWIHVVLRRAVRTERLLHLPIGVSTLLFALITFIATGFVTDGVIQFCSNSESYICSSSGSIAFARSRWKMISLLVGMNETIL
jgi:hypothetical protein